MPASALVAAGSIGSAVIGSNAANKAAKNSKNAADQANQVATNVYNTNQANLNPYIQTGTAANNNLAGLLGVGGDKAASQDAFNNYLNSSNYNFVLDQGLKSVGTQNAASYGSGAFAKALNNYAQGQAGNTLQGYESMLAGLGNQGLQGASSLAGVGGQYANQYGSTLTNGAAQQNAYKQDSAGQWQSGIQGALYGAGGASTPYGQQNLSALSSGIQNLFSGTSSYGQQPSASSYTGTGLDNNSGITMPAQYAFNLGGL